MWLAAWELRIANDQMFAAEKVLGGRSMTHGNKQVNKPSHGAGAELDFNINRCLL